MKKKVIAISTAVFATLGLTAPANAYVYIVCDPISMTCETIECLPQEVDLPDGTTQTIEVCDVVGDPEFPG